MEKKITAEIIFNVERLGTFLLISGRKQGFLLDNVLEILPRTIL